MKARESMVCVRATTISGAREHRDPAVQPLHKDGARLDVRVSFGKVSGYYPDTDIEVHMEGVRVACVRA